MWVTDQECSCASATRRASSTVEIEGTIYCVKCRCVRGPIVRQSNDGQDSPRNLDEVSASAKQGGAILSVQRCETCRAPYEADERFCGMCGADLRKSRMNSVKADTVRPAAREQKPVRRPQVASSGTARSNAPSRAGIYVIASLVALLVVALGSVVAINGSPSGSSTSSTNTTQHQGSESQQSMPDVVGMRLDQAYEDVETAGYRIVNVSYYGQPPLGGGPRASWIVVEQKDSPSTKNGLNVWVRPA